MIGFITLLGFTILLLSHYQRLVVREGRNWNVQITIDGAVDRLPAILMAGLLASMGLLPVAFSRWKIERMFKDGKGDLGLNHCGAQVPVDPAASDSQWYEFFFSRRVPPGS